MKSGSDNALLTGGMTRRLALAAPALLSIRPASAQPRRLPLVVSVNAGSYSANAPFVEAFEQGMADRGYIKGRNVEYVHMWADQQYDRLPDMAAEAVRRGANLIVTTSIPASARAAMNATRDIPIVFASNADPVEAGLVASLARPGGNVTGVSYLFVVLYPKWLDLLSELLPKPTKIGFMVNPKAPLDTKSLRELQEAARTKQVELVVLEAGDEKEIEAVIKNAAGPPPVPLLVQNDQLYNIHRPMIIELGNRYRVPTMGSANRGGLMSYGPDAVWVYREFGVMAGKVLGGIKPADLPVEQPTRFNLMLNMKAAKALGVAFPPAMAAAATEIIE
jgi:putative ABC transport system substrate-binding protein